MKLAVLSDIHGNALALEAVLADLALQGGADTLVVAGDLCLDGPRPREVLERLQALGCPVVQGNTDRDLVHPTPEGTDAEHAALLHWTREQIGPVGLAYLAGLPFSHRVADPTGETAVLVVHANPRDLDTAMRPLAPQETITPLLADLPAAINTVVFGHVHLPYTRKLGGLLLADIASVGLPKDGDRRAGYGLLTWAGDRWQVEQRRVEYAVDEVVAQLRAADPPGAMQLIRQLLRARYPNMAAARGGRQSVRPSASTTVAPAPTPRPSRPVRVAPPPVPTPPVPSVALTAPVEPPAAVVAEAVVIETPVAVVSEPVEPTVSAAPAVAAAPELDLARPAKPKSVPKKAKRAAKGAEQLAFAAGDSFPAIVPQLLTERLAAVLVPLPIVRADEDPEGVHDMRVGIRRLREALEPAEPFYDAKGYKRASRRVKALARALGRVRDGDVHLESLQARLATAAPDERAGLAGVIDAIVAARAAARADLDPALDPWKGRHGSHIADLRAFIAKARPRKQKGRDRDSVAAVALQALTGRLESLTEVIPVLNTSAHSDPEAFHAVRIVAKKLRYTLELFSPVLGPDVPGLLAELKTLQDQLGELHDRDVLLELLHEERLAAAERELDALQRATYEAGTRTERLAAVQAQFAAPDGFAATAPGVYGLLIDLRDERDALMVTSRERWAALTAAGFLDRLWGLTAGLSQTLAELAAPSIPPNPAVEDPPGDAAAAM